MSAADDVDVVLDRHAPEELDVGIGEAVQHARSDAWARGWEQTEELVGEQLGEEQEVRAVLAGGVHEELGLPLEALEVLDGAHLVLHRGHPRTRHVIATLARRVERVEPLHEHRAPARLLVGRQVAVEHLADHEAVGELCGDHRVGEFFGDHLGEVGVGAHLALMKRVARHAPCDHHLAEIELADELVPRLVDAPREAHPARFGADHDVDPVEQVAVWVVVPERAARDDLLEGVDVVVVFGVEDQAAGARHQDAVELDADLPTREDFDVLADVAGRPRRDVGKTPPLQLSNAFDVLYGEAPDNQPRFGLFAFAHAQALSTLPRASTRIRVLAPPGEPRPSTRGAPRSPCGGSLPDGARALARRRE